MTCWENMKGKIESKNIKSHNRDNDLNYFVKVQGIKKRNLQNKLNVFICQRYHNES